MATLSDGRDVVGNPIAFIVETEPGVRDLPLRRHLHLRHASDRRAVPADRRAARLHAPARALAPDARAGDLLDGRDGRRTRRLAQPRCSGSSSPSPAITWRSDEEVDRFVELVPKYDTTGRRRVVAPLVGETLVVEPGKPLDRERERRRGHLSDDGRRRAQPPPPGRRRARAADANPTSGPGDGVSRRLRPQVRANRDDGARPPDLRRGSRSELEHHRGRDLGTHG